MTRRLLWLGAFLLAAPLQAQNEGLGEQCSGASAASRGFCQRVAEAVQVIEPRIGISFSGGNPVPGTASTLGMRLGTLPRISIGARLSAARVEIGGIESASDDDEQSFFVPSINVDGSIGIFSGLSLAPTIGGFGSIDLLASVGRIPLPEGEGFSGAANSWGAGLRVGLLRESFTAPGVSVSAMYRKVGEIEYGDPELNDQDAYFRLDDMSTWSVRAAASKRLLGFGLTGGAGYDRYSGGVNVQVRDPLASGGRFSLADDELESSRTTLFGNASLTLLILHLVGEVGWQSGGDADTSLPTDRIEKAGLYGGLAIRVSL